MNEKKKSKQAVDGDSDERFDHLVPVSGGTIRAEVVEDDESNRIRFRIQEIARHVDQSRLELGALFFRVRLNAIYVKWDSPVTGKPYRTWEEYVDTESSFGVRSIQHMVAMWWWFSELASFPQIRQRINDIGWAKARVLVGLADDTNYEAWFDLAAALPKDKLEVNARAAMARAGIPRRPSIGVGRPNPRGVLPAEAETVAPAPGVRGAPGADGIVANLADDALVAPVDSAPVNVTPVAPLGGEDGERQFPGDGGEPGPEPEARKGAAVPTQDELAIFEEKKARWYCQMDAAQKEHVEKACMAAYDVLKEAGDMTKRPASDEIGFGLALEMICTHFLSFYTGSNATNKGLRTRVYFDDIMKGLERNFGVSVIAIDKKNGNMLHGMPEGVFQTLEERLGVHVVVLRQGTNECVYGYENMARIAGEEEPGEGGGEES